MGEGEGPNGTVADDQALSLLAGLRQEHRAVQRSKTIKLPVPGYKGRLVVEYAVIPWDEERELETRNSQAPDHARKELNHFMDQLLAGCKQILVDDGNELVPLDPVNPVKWGDRRLADGLGIELAEEYRARDVLYAVFAHGEADEERVPYVISEHHTEFTDWMLGKGDEAERDYLGK